MKIMSYTRFFVLTVLLSAGIPAGAEIVLTQNNDSRSDEQGPRPGTLVMPGQEKEDEQVKEKCMTVCARWGEECTYINRGTGGTTRKCRRTCKQFTEECF